MVDVKPMHCQNVLNSMVDKYKDSKIEQTRITMCSMYYYAMINGTIAVSPINKMVKLPKPVDKKVHFFMIDEQNRFFEQTKETAYENQFRLFVQTGLRTGEMVGLKWGDLDFENR